MCRRGVNWMLPSSTNGMPYLRVVVAVAAAEVAVLAGAGDADRAEARRATACSPLRPSGVSTSPDRRPLPAACSAHLPLPDEEVGGAAGIRRGDPKSNVAPPCVPVDGLGRNRVRDDVDEAADRVRSVEQRRRAAHDFDRRRAGGVHRHAVIAGLTRQVADALTVLEDEHAIAVETADDRSRRSGPERALGNTGLVRERRAETVPRSCFARSWPESTVVGW